MSGSWDVAGLACDVSADQDLGGKSKREEVAGAWFGRGYGGRGEWVVEMGRMVAG